ncbi:GNAT family N-acetyltransferase [Luteimonas sp. MC1895]|uniref:GNAT family N-acetyltransferase n=1 Tax=Luteimonas sp. MC1895 TaxID=2819513 RepID=UPI0018F07D14|nr:GNAT family N-acetyltransferase [Luteimonas sp. MC1895]
MNTASDLISSDEWAEVLARGFGSVQLVIREGAGFPRTAWSVFSKMGLRAAYSNFPVGFEDGVAGSMMPAITADLRASGVDLARFSFPRTVDALSELERFRTIDLLETRVDSLEDWSEQDLPRTLKKKLEKSRRAGVQIRDALHDEGALLHRIYSETVVRRRGVVRYTPGYFDALCKLSRDDGRLSVGVVVRRDGTPCGFIVIAHSETSSYYLHGGYYSHSANLRPGYIAMAWGIDRAKNYHSRQFNMLTSPLDQPALVAYKESFGGKSYARSHYELPVSKMGALVHAVLCTSRRTRLIFR